MDTALPDSEYSCILMRWSMEVFATGYHRSAMKLKQVRVCPTCTQTHFITLRLQVAWWRNGSVSDLRSTGRGFDFQSGCYQVASTWTGDCLWTAKLSRYITNHQDQLRVGKSSIDLSLTFTTYPCLRHYRLSFKKCSINLLIRTKII